MPALSHYSNVNNTALVILQRKGFRLWTEQGGEVLCAEKDGWNSRADDAVPLLGLVATYEVQQPSEHREYWWRLNEPWLLYDLPDRGPEFGRCLRGNSCAPSSVVGKLGRFAKF